MPEPEPEVVSGTLPESRPEIRPEIRPEHLPGKDGAAAGRLQPSESARFRRMAMTDLAAVLRNETRSYQFPWTAGIFADCIASSENECWVVEQDQAVIGHGVLSHGAGEAHLLNVCIVRDRQGQGCGRLLAEHLLDRAREQNAAVVYLEVRPSNRVARALYASLGFREVGRRRDYYPAANGNEEACVMALVLA